MSVILDFEDMVLSFLLQISLSTFVSVLPILLFPLIFVIALDFEQSAFGGCCLRLTRSGNRPFINFAHVPVIMREINDRNSATLSVLSFRCV